MARLPAAPPLLHEGSLVSSLHSTFHPLRRARVRPLELLHQPLIVQEGGTYTAGATITIGTVYCISDTAGGICALAAVPSASKITILGIGATTTTIDMAQKSYTGYAQP